MKKNIKACKFCHQLKHLPGGANYCTACYRKFVRAKKECKRCHHLKVIVARGYCGACYNYVMGYYGLGGFEADSRIRWRTETQKCFFCDEKRTQMLNPHCLERKEGGGAERMVLLCPSHHREVHLGLKELPVNK